MCSPGPRPALSLPGCGSQTPSACASSPSGLSLCQSSGAIPELQGQAVTPLTGQGHFLKCPLENDFGSELTRDSHHMRGSRICHPRICLFGDTDYFKLIVFKKQKTREETLAFPLAAKNLGGGPAQEGATSQGTRSDGQGGTQHTLLIQVPSASHCDVWPSKRSFTNGCFSNFM